MTYATVQDNRLKKTLDKDLAKEYCLNETGVCDAFEIGQEFIAQYPNISLIYALVAVISS